MKTDAQLRESSDRFQRVFWEQRPDGRPPVGVVDTNVCLPVKYLRPVPSGRRPRPLHEVQRRNRAASRPHVVFHLHSTGYRHCGPVLQVPGLAGLQMTIEANGPPVVEPVPVFRRILEQSRLMIFADHRFGALAAVLPQLPAEGLHVVVPERFIATEAEFLAFHASVRWRGQ